MDDIKSFDLNLPYFIERSYYISPGVVSVIFKVIWSLFLFLLVFFLVEQGLGAIAIKNLQKNDSKNSLWFLHENHSQVQGVSRGQWGNMLQNIGSRRTFFGLLFWAILYGFEILFSLSIDTATVTHYNGTNCVGRIANYNFDPYFTFDLADGSHTVLPKNGELLRQLVKQKHVGNMVILGDGIFTIAPQGGIYAQGQNVTVSRVGLNCNTTATNIFMHNDGYISGLRGDTSAKTTSTPKLPNISLDVMASINSMNPISYGYVNLKKIDTRFDYIDPNSSYVSEVTYLISVSNPAHNRKNDINQKKFNNTVFLSECVFFYEHGNVTMLVDGELNATNVEGQYTKIDNKTLAEEFKNANTRTFFDLNKNFFTLYDYPDTFADPNYNQTYTDILKTANDIIAAYFLSPYDPYADLCTFNNEETPIFISVLGTKMSFGYIIVAVAFAIGTLVILTIFVLVMYSKEERNSWFLYSKDWCYEGYLATGSQMDKKGFKQYSKEITIQSNSSEDMTASDDSANELLKNNESDRLTNTL